MNSEQPDEHRDDIEWWRAPLPRRWHRCTPWTTAFVDGERVERCACGALRVSCRGCTQLHVAFKLRVSCRSCGQWLERNSRQYVCDEHERAAAHQRVDQLLDEWQLASAARRRQITAELSTMRLL
jgi:ribosomal protein S27E